MSVSRSSVGGGAPARAGWTAPVVAIGLFGLLVLACAGAGAWAEIAPESPAADILPLAEPHAALANLQLTSHEGARGLDAAERETRRQLALSPGAATAWVRLAYIDLLRAGRLTPAALANLDRSYEVAPLGPDATSARLRFAFEQWGRMPPQVRKEAMTELAAARQRDRDAALRLAGQIRDPEGRLAIGMGLASLDSEDALKTLD